MRERELHGATACSCGPRCRATFEESAARVRAHARRPRFRSGRPTGSRCGFLIGNAFGRQSPVATFAPTLYLDVVAEAGAPLELPASLGERAVYGIDAPLAIDGTDVPAHTMAVLEPGEPATVVAKQRARYVVIGGEPLDGPRFIFWNYVSSSRERIERAKEDWTAQRMGRIPGETEWIPLP